MTKFFAASLLPSVMSPLSDCAETLSEALASNRIGLVLRESCYSCYIYTVSSVCFVIEEIKLKNNDFPKQSSLIIQFDLESQYLALII